jgi:ABC-type amino acid transport substrate-binding protein
MWRAVLWVIALTVGATGPAQASESLTVGIRVVPPFVIDQGDGQYGGIAVDLWRAIASELELDYELRPMGLDELLASLQDGSADVGVAALTVTDEREGFMDFSHPFFRTGLGIAVPGAPPSLWATISAVFSVDFIKALGALAVVVGGVGVLIWLLERRANPGQFGGPPHAGIGSGFWWSAVTMTTVGYGDKAPVSAPGRALAIVWMFLSAITISGFTAAITSAFTLHRLDARIYSLADVSGKRVGTVENSTSEDFLLGLGVRPRLHASAPAALEALAQGDLDAVVYDAPVMRYLIAQGEVEGLRVLSENLRRQDYALAFPPESPARESVNRSLLRQVADPSWEQILNGYLGAGE